MPGTRSPNVVLIAVLSTAALSPVMAEGVELSLAIDVPGPDMTLAAVEGVGPLPGASWLNRPGEPQIPWQVMTVLLPPDADLETASARLAGETYELVDGERSVAPTPPLATWDGERQVTVWPPDKTIVDGRDVAIYGADAYWPATGIRTLDVGRLRQWQLATVAVPLVRYNPVRGELRRLTAGQVVVRFERKDPLAPDADQDAPITDAIGEDRVRKIVVNFEDQRAAYQTAMTSALADGEEPESDSRPVYTIITTSDIQSTSSKLAEFVAHKEVYGYDVQVITEADFGGGTGNTAAENIRAWLQAHYASDHIEYVLLIGNPHPSAGGVPMKMLWPRHNYTEYKEAPSDYYYADLTGNWDLDSDGYYGEWSDDFGSGGVDRHSEVLVGRIPHLSTIADLDHVLQKVMDYERQPSTVAVWRKNVLLPMEPSDDSTPGYHLGEAIKNDVAVPAGWGYHRVYEEEYGLVPPPETTPCTVSNVVAAWTGGTFGLVVWWTHGSSGSASDVMNVFNTQYLNDDYPSFTFQVSCNNSYPEVANLSAYLLRNGAICTVGATRVSWYYVGQTSFAGSASNSGMGYEYATRVVPGDVTCGEALHDLKSALTPYSSSIWMNFVVFNIYGDPATCMVPASYPLNLEVFNGLFGSVELEPEPNDPCAAAYPAGTAVTLTAQPAESRSFGHWNIYDPNHPGDANYAVTDSNATITIDMTTARQVAASFTCGSGPLLGSAAMTLGLLGVVALRRRR